MIGGVNFSWSGTENLNFHLLKDKPAQIWNKKGISVFEAERFQLHIDRAACLIWPNREGERIALPSLGQKLTTLPQARLGVTIKYPSIASCRTVILESEEGGGFLIVCPPDHDGKVTGFTLKSGDPCLAILEICAPDSTWAIAPFKGGLEGCRQAMERVKKLLPWPIIQRQSVTARFQVQVGLIDSDRFSSVPTDQGFLVLAEIARHMRKSIGEGNILHVFGYAHGHDRGYPDYSPSRRLGGEKLLQRAIQGVHEHKQSAVFYLNPRIAQYDRLPESLYSAILRDREGDPYGESYHGRRFVVMDPCSEAWINHILVQAVSLAAIGADGVQLDQIAGRNALAEPGAEWGAGYLQMIDRIHALGLHVWIEGLSDLYPADWFEMTDREPAISEDGTIHSGHPFGESAVELFHLTVPDAPLLVPFVNLQKIPKSLKMKIITDINRPKGELFLYDADYICTLDAILSHIKSTI